MSLKLVLSTEPNNKEGKTLTKSFKIFRRVAQKNGFSGAPAWMKSAWECPLLPDPHLIESTVVK